MKKNISKSKKNVSSLSEAGLNLIAEEKHKFFEAISFLNVRQKHTKDNLLSFQDCDPNKGCPITKVHEELTKSWKEYRDLIRDIEFYYAG